MRLIWQLGFVVPTQLCEIVLGHHSAFHVFMLRNQNGPWITRIGTNDHVVVEESHDASCATEHGIDSWGFGFHFVLNSLKRLLDLLITNPMILIQNPLLLNEFVHADFVLWFSHSLLVFHLKFIVSIVFHLSEWWQKRIQLLLLVVPCRTWKLVSTSRRSLIYEIRQYLRHVLLDEIGNQMSVGSMTIADSHHPQVLDTSKIIVHNKRVLIRFLLPWDKSLPGFDAVSQDGPFHVLRIGPPDFNLGLMLAQMRRIWVLPRRNHWMSGQSFVRTVVAGRNPSVTCRYLTVNLLIQFVVQHWLRSLVILLVRDPLIRWLRMLTVIWVIALKIAVNIFVQLLLLDQFLFIYELAGKLNVVLFEVQWLLGFVNYILTISNIFVFLDLHAVILVDILRLEHLILVLPNPSVFISTLLHHLVCFFKPHFRLILPQLPLQIDSQLRWVLHFRRNSWLRRFENLIQLIIKWLVTTIELLPFFLGLHNEAFFTVVVPIWRWVGKSTSTLIFGQLLVPIT